MADVFERVKGQTLAVEELRAASRSPVHAYLFVGPPGTGKLAAALSFAAALVCPRGGCGECDHCRRALTRSHPDVVVRERTGASIAVEDAREVARLAARGPIEAERQVLVLVDFHLVDKAAPALLKTIEEPPPTTVFVVLAEYVSPELVTIASRCVRVDFNPLSHEDLVSQLEAEGADPDDAIRAAAGSGGRLDRARLLVSDSGSTARLEAWRAVPSRLDGTGATVAVIAEELLAACNSVVEPLRAAQEAELSALGEMAKTAGERGIPGRREIDERHRREQRRARTDELRFGLTTLADSYRERLEAAAVTEEGTGVTACLSALEAIHDAGEVLVRNPNESLLVQALLLRLSGLAPDIPSVVGTGG
jgi:DNA polymerase-3 subunit delta'